MIGYVIRRVALALSLVWAVSFFGFVAFALTFDPLWQQRMCGAPCAHQVKVLTVQYHLNKPVLERYWIWLSDFVGHRFSFRGIGGFPINAQLLDAAKVTTELMACALLVTAIFAVVVGVASARRAGRPLDYLLRTLAYMSWSLPAFLVASVAVRWVVPSVGWFLLGVTAGLPPGAVAQGAPARAGGFVIWLRGMTLPVLTLSLGLIGLYSRYVRTALLTELHRPYAVTARSKGLTETRVAYRHALRNALPPFVSVLSLEIGAILGASLAIDYVFYMGGLASYFLGGLTQAADPYVLTAVVIVASCIVVLFMLVSDLAVGWLDPRTAATASR
ncbi:MAG TPA: ABC transporter permease [Gaiellaceae bacterium]|nr:ABC transporter permease [Gaiellaceae bacterium]